MLRRYNHLLKANARSQRPWHVVFVDTESTQTQQVDGSVTHSLKLGVACSWRLPRRRQPERLEWHTFHAPDEFCTWLWERWHKKETLWLVSHNLNFDLPMLDLNHQLVARGMTLAHFYFAGLTGMVTWRDKYRKMRALDNMNLFATSLERLGAAIGVVKGQVNFSTVSDDELAAYCRQDVEVMLAAWRKWLSFLDDRDLGNFAPTLASQVFNAYRHRFMLHPIYIHGSDDAVALERASYSGGRVDVFRRGHWQGQRMTKLDVNAMYPSMMATGEYPRQLIGLGGPCSLANLEYLVARFALVADVVVNVDEPVFPAYVRGFRAYPVGRFRAVLTTDELRYALEHGWLESVVQTARYHRARLFTEWVAYIWSLESQAKLDGDSVLCWQCKLLRNALYGKWGQSGLDRVDLGETSQLALGATEMYDPERRQWIHEYDFAGRRWRDTSGEASFNAFPAIAAHVTAQARLRLWQLIRQAGQEHVYYCDTDSLIVDDAGRDALADQIDPGRLGYLKVEDESDSLTIWSPKEYQLGESVKRKGVRASATDIGSGYFIQDQWAGLLQTWRSSHPDRVHVYPVTKHLERRINSGVVMPGGIIAPWQVDLVGETLTVLNDPASLGL